MEERSKGRSVVHVRPPMFALAVRPIGASKEPLRSLPSPRRETLGPHFVCDIHCNPDRFNVALEDGILTISEKTAGLGVVCRLDLRAGSGAIVKPLMLGLPIYFAAGTDSLFVATRVALLRACGVSLEENTAVLPEYFVYRYVTPPSTLFKHVRSLPIGATLQVRAEGTGLACDLHWTTAFERDREPYSFEEGTARFERDLVERVASLAPARDSVACLLSGGLDSSALYKIARDTLGIADSHSTGYPFENQDYERRAGERHYAETAARALGSAHQFHEFTSTEFLHGLVETIDQAESPLVHLQSVLLGLLFKTGLRDRDRIVLCGQGADALVGLTLMFNYVDKRYLIKRALAPLHGALSTIVPESFIPFARLERWSRRTWNSDYARPDHALWMMGEFGDREWVRSYFGVSDDAIVRGRLDAVTRMKPEHPIHAFSLLDFVSDVAVTQDIWGHLAAAYGRTAFYPFNSPGLLTAVHNIPWSEKLSQPKRVMVRLGQRLGIPEFILSRPKLGFGVKSSRWSARGGVAEPILDLLAPVVDPELVRAFEGDDERRAMICWNWMNYGLWKRLVIQGEARQDLAAELDEAMSSRAAS